MALSRKLDPSLEALLQQAIEEQRAVNPDLFREPQPLSDEVYAQILKDAAEIERIWDEMDKKQPDMPKVSAADIISKDRGE
jgi:hypothetical protein